MEGAATYTLCPTPASECHMMFPAVMFSLLYHALHLAFMLTILLQRDANRALDYPSHTHQHTLFYISNLFVRCIYICFENLCLEFASIEKRRAGHVARMG